ncbi:MAG: cell wall-binding repeat-containing protein [Acidimicrobiales bacterium]
MRHKSARIRRLAVFAVGSVTAISATAVIGAGAAYAASTAVQSTGGTITPVEAPTIFPGVANQAAGNWTFTSANSFSQYDTLTIDLAQCQTSTDFIGFAATPTVTVATNGTTETMPVITAKLAQQTGEGAACVAAGVKDQLVLTFGNTASSTGTTPWTVTISGVSYTVGSAFAPGTSVAASATYQPSATGVAAVTDTITPDAAVAPFAVTGDTPGVGLAPGATDAAISNVVITEYVPGEVAAGTVSVALSNGTFDTSSTPSVAASGGGAVVGKVSGAGTATLTFPVTTASSNTPATYTLSGLAVDVPSSATGGPVTVDVTNYDSASATTSTLAPGVEVFSVVSSSRIFGEASADTSAALFEKNGCNPTRSAVLATSNSFADALSASYLASQLGTSVLVTPTAAVASSTLTALRLEGVDNVFVVGGPLAISSADIATLKATPSYKCGGLVGNYTLLGTAQNLQVTQIYGQTQYGTAEQVAEYSGSGAVGSVAVPGAYGGMYNDTTGSNGTSATAAPTTAVPTAILAVGTNYPDAMAASAMAYKEKLPVLLTETNSLAPEAEAAIVNLGIQQVIVMGGPLAVSDNVVTQLMGLGVSTFRIAGTDATDTAQLLAQFELNYQNASGVADGLNWSPAQGLVVTRGDYYTDALSASAYAGSNEMPIVLTENPTTVGQYLTSFLNTAGTVGYGSHVVYNFTVLGGSLAIAPSTVTAISNALAANS